MSVIFRIPKTLKVPIMSYHRILNDESDNTSLNIHPSCLLPILQEEEKKFFTLVSAGDVQSVSSLLDLNEDFNINCVNYQGLTALHIAIQKRDDKMIRFLLSIPDIDVKDCTLYAIKENKPKILELLLNRLRETSSEQEFCGCTQTQSTAFSDCITPLTLAAQLGHYEIIGTLLSRGHKFPKPHMPGCNCSDCEMLKFSSDDPLHVEKRRLHCYQALTNPAYICHVSDDPILTAFKLSYELENCASLVPAFRAAYCQLSKDVSQFAVDLVGLCRNAEEVQLVLKQQRGMCSGHFLYPRLVLAMDMDQENFVAHPNTQQIMDATWHGEWTMWRNYSLLRKTYICVLRVFILPIIAILCIIVPHSKLVKHWSLPINKMLSHIASYITFLAIIFWQSCQDKTDQLQGPPKSGLEPLIIIYVIGFIWSTVRLAVLQGPARYFRRFWSWYDVLMLAFFIATFSFWFLSYMDVKNSGGVILERKYWHYFEHTLVAEGLFTIAVIMAFFRLLSVCELDYNLGPLQISLGKMSVDIAKFAVIFAIIIAAFTAGLCTLYQYYDGMVQVDTASGIKTVQQTSFVNLPSTLTTLFWALFCMSPIESADVVIENLPGDKDSKLINHHSFTEAVGYFAFAIYEVLCVIVILNMLIATMSNTFQRVTDNVDIEWTFGRIKIYVQYILQTTLPPPYNLIPTMAGLSTLTEWFIGFISARHDKKAYCTVGQCCYIEKETDKQMANDYPILMSQLVQRYFRKQESASKTSNEEYEYLKKEISILKAKVNELLKC